MYIYVNNYRIGVPDDMVHLSMQPNSDLAIIPETVSSREARALLFQTNTIVNRLATALDVQEVTEDLAHNSRLVENLLTEFRSELLNLDRVLRKNASHNYYRVLTGSDAKKYKPNGGYFHIIIENQFEDLRYVILFHNRAIKRLEGTSTCLMGYTCKRVLLSSIEQVKYDKSNTENLIDGIVNSQNQDTIAASDDSTDEHISVQDHSVNDSSLMPQASDSLLFHSNANSDELCYEVKLDLNDCPLNISSVNGTFLNLDIEISFDNCSSFSLAKLDQISYSSYEIIQDTTTVKNLGEVNFVHFNEVLAQLIEHIVAYEKAAPQLEFDIARTYALQDVRDQVERGLAIDSLTTNLTTISELTDEVSTVSQIDEVNLNLVLKTAKHGLLVSSGPGSADDVSVNILGTYLDDLSYYRTYGEYIASLTQLQWNVPFIVGTMFENNTLDKSLAADIKTVESEIASFAKEQPLDEGEIEKLNVLIDLLNSTQVKLTNTLIAQHIDKVQASKLDKILNTLSTIEYRSTVYKTPFIFDGSSLTGNCHQCELDPEGSGDVTILFNDGLNVVMPGLRKRRGTFTVTVESSADCTGAKNSEIQHFIRDYFLLSDFNANLTDIYFEHYGEESPALESLRISQVQELQHLKDQINILLEKHRNFQHAQKQITHLNIVLDKMREYQSYITLGLSKDLDVLPFRLLANLPEAAYDQVEIMHRRLKPEVRGEIMRTMSILSNIDFNYGTYNSTTIAETLDKTIVGRRIALNVSDLPFNATSTIGYTGSGFQGDPISETQKVTLSKGYNGPKKSFAVKQVMESWRKAHPEGYNAIVALAKSASPKPVPFRIDWNLLVMPSLEARVVDKIVKAVFSSSLLNSRRTEDAIKTELYNTTLFRQICERVVSEFEAYIDEISTQVKNLTGPINIIVTSSKQGSHGEAGGLWTTYHYGRNYKMGNMHINQGVHFYDLNTNHGQYHWDHALPYGLQNVAVLNEVIKDYSLSTVYYRDYPSGSKNQVRTYRTADEVPPTNHISYGVPQEYDIKSVSVPSIYFPAANTEFRLSNGSGRIVTPGEVILNLASSTNAPDYFLGGVGTATSETPIIDHHFAGEEHWPSVPGSASCRLEIPISFTFTPAHAKQLVARFNAAKESDLRAAFEEFLDGAGLEQGWKPFENIFINSVASSLVEFKELATRLYRDIESNLISIIIPDVNEVGIFRELHLRDVYEDNGEQYEKEKGSTWYIRKAEELNPEAESFNEIYNLYQDEIGGIKYEEVSVDQETGTRRICLHHDKAHNITYYLHLLKPDVASSDLTTTDFDALSLERTKDYLPTSNYLISYSIGTGTEDAIFEGADGSVNPKELILATTLGVYSLQDLITSRLIKPSELREIVCYKVGQIEDQANVVRGLFASSLDIVGYLNDESEVTHDSTGRVGFPYSPVSFLANVVAHMNPRKYAIDKLRSELGYKTVENASKLITDPGITLSDRSVLDDKEILILLDVNSSERLRIETSTINIKLFPDNTYYETTIDNILLQLRKMADLAQSFPRIMLVNQGTKYMTVSEGQTSVFDNVYVIQRVSEGKVHYRFMFTSDQILFLEALSLLHDCNKGESRKYLHNELYSVLVSPKMAGYIVLEKKAYLADVMRG